MTTFAVHPVPGPDAEDVLVITEGEHAGAVLTGTSDGSIWRVAADGSDVQRVARTGGRPLGLEHHPEGGLVVCDAERGLLRLHLDHDDGEPLVETLMARGTDVDGVRLRLCNNAAVAADGTVYFSDSSARHDLPHWRRDLGEHTRSGRLLRRSPDGEVTVLATGLAFANGVALLPGDGTSDGDDGGARVLVAETGARTVVAVPVPATPPPAAETTDEPLLSAAEQRAAELRQAAASRTARPAPPPPVPFVEDLPGYPDNIALGSDGLVWVALASPTNPVVEALHRAPMGLRRAAVRTPTFLQPGIARTVRAQAYDAAGQLVHDVDVDPVEHGVEYHAVTGVREHEGRLWLASFAEPAVAVLDLTST